MDSIIVAIDFSGDVEFLVTSVINDLKASKNKIYLIHVAAPDPDFVGNAVGPSAVRDQLARHYHEEHQKLQALKARVEEGGYQCAALLLQGKTVEVLLEQASSLDARRIIVGFNKHSKAHDLIFGSVICSLIKGTNVPVLVVPAR